MNSIKGIFTPKLLICLNKKLTHDNACIEEILFIGLYQNVSKDSKDKNISLFILLSIIALNAKQMISTLHCGG